MKFITGVTLVAFALTGCAGFSPSKNRAPQAEWRVGKFLVEFYPGPRASGPDRTYSYYSITNLSLENVAPGVVESAYQEGAYGKPKDNIRVIGSSSGDQILIEENVPNDCCPCTNYALVSADSYGFDHTFLKIPERRFGPPQPGPDFGEYPQVKSIEGGVLELRYFNGVTERKKIDEIERADRPQQPG